MKQSALISLKSLQSAPRGKGDEPADPKVALKNLPGITYLDEHTRASVGKRRQVRAEPEDIAKMERVRHPSRTKPDADTQARGMNPMDSDVAAFFYHHED